MTKILAVYGTNYGQTAKVLQRMAAVLTGRGLTVTLTNVAEFAGTNLDAFDAFLIGASVMRGEHQRPVRDFIATHLARLNASPTAFVSVSGAAGSPLPENQREARRYVEELLRHTGWRPSVSITVGGAMAYTKYGFWMRLLLKLISARKGGPTDTSRDHEMTDWNAVDRFAERLAEIWAPALATSCAVDAGPGGCGCDQ